LTDTRPARFAIVGTGWRASFYLQAASQLPDLLQCVRGFTRSAETATNFSARWGLPVHTSEADFFEGLDVDFILLSLPSSAVESWATKLGERGIPVLVETPAARTFDGLVEMHDLAARTRGLRLQVAEQYRFQPMHAARMAVARSGVLGPITNAHVSVAHEYHAMSLVRGILGLGFVDVEVSASSFDDRVAATVSRDGWTRDHAVVPSPRVTAELRFPESNQAATYVFSDEQYFSPLRSRRLDVWGERGEIAGDQVRYLDPRDELVRTQFVRDDAGADGDLRGHSLEAILVGTETVFRNELFPARLSDDELAIAQILLRMAKYARDGEEFYGLADASEDEYLSLLIAEAAATGGVVSSGERPWKNSPSVYAGDHTDGAH
jgi:predicted dehydrogenase